MLRVVYTHSVFFGVFFGSAEDRVIPTPCPTKLETGNLVVNLNVISDKLKKRANMIIYIGKVKTMTL